MIVVKIALRRPDLKSEKVVLINDALIALFCRDIGANLVTLSLEDFELIRGFVRFRFREF